MSGDNIFDSTPLERRLEDNCLPSSAIENSETDRLVHLNTVEDSDVIRYEQDEVSPTFDSSLSHTLTELESSVSLSPQSSSCEAALNSSPHCFPTEPPIFPLTANHYWGTTYRANDPCEDRFASLTNILLSPNHPTNGYNDPSPSVTSLNHPSPRTYSPKEQQLQPLFRVSMFCVLDGHGGPFVADCASKHLLPMLSSNIRKSFDCTYISMGEFRINQDVIPFQQDDKNEDFGEFEITDPWYTSPRDAFCCPYHASLAANIKTTTTTEDHQILSTSTTKNGGLSDCNRVEYTVQQEEEPTTRKSITPDMLCEAPTELVPHHQEPLNLRKSTTELLPHENAPEPPPPSSIDMQPILTQTIRETFLQLDELWMNGINIQRLRPACYMTNDKCNAGSCCLVTILIQKSMYKVQGGKYIRYSSEAPCLYTSHLGDCRAILLNHPRGDNDDDCSDGEEDDDIENHEALLDSFSDDDDDDSDDTEEQDADMSSCSSNESHDSFFQDEQRVDTTRNHRMIPFKKRLLPVNRSIVIPRSIVPSICLQSITLTRDHTPYNHAEAMLVRQRCKNAPNAIAPAISGGIKRVAGSLSVTRALGDAYLKCKRVSFAPFKDHAPYITACPEIRMREIDDRAMFLVLGTDGVWEKVDGAKIAKWVSKFFDKLTEENQADTLDGEDCQSIANASVGSTRKRRRDPFSPLSAHSIASRTNSLTKSKISDVIAWKILNKVRRTRKMKSLKSLMAFPPGRARRLRHDDITACVVDLAGFIDFVDYQT